MSMRPEMCLVYNRVLIHKATHITSQLFFFNLSPLPSRHTTQKTKRYWRESQNNRLSMNDIMSKGVNWAKMNKNESVNNLGE